MKLDVGCGQICKPGFIGVDYKKYNDKIKFIVNLNKSKLPFKDNSIEEIYCSHVLEHLDNPMETIGEFYRVLLKGGKLKIIVPHYSNPLGKVPIHKTEWGFRTEFVLSTYHENNCNWEKINVSYSWNTNNILRKIIDFPFDLIINWNKTIYERHFACINPIYELIFDLEK
ncbi:MAG: class I SAM-dependent methyltransferase [Candidatus ainarchaeum sp.]|nr:class I SAM-dependent methyltransferase [Candidatus ainarchaeum sp.]